jgi:hypothetical protein
MNFKTTANPNGVYFAPQGTIFTNDNGNISVLFPDGSSSCNVYTFNSGSRSFIYDPKNTIPSFYGTWVKSTDISSNFGWDFHS